MMKKLVSNEDVSIDDLLVALKKFMERKKLEKPLKTTVTKKELSVSDRVKHIRNVLKEKKQATFNELFETFSKNYVVVTFLSILEMSKNKEIEIVQDKNFDDIIIRGC